MNTIAEFTIIGRVGEIQQVGTTLRVSIASSYSRKDNRGEWIERTRWNEVTVFGESTRGYVKRNIVKGDLVLASGSMGQTKWEKDGETFYGVTLAGERIERLSKGPNHQGNSPDEPQEQRPARGNDDDIPFWPPRLSRRRDIEGDANPWPIRFTASENGNGSAPYRSPPGGRPIRSSSTPTTAHSDETRP
jgi:single-stranded DNA-binding protein